MMALAQNVQVIQVLNSGHYVPEEQPGFVIDQLFKFFGNGTAINEQRAAQSIRLLLSLL
jgi:hypothetical protein